MASTRPKLSREALAVAPWANALATYFPKDASRETRPGSARGPSSAPMTPEALEAEVEAETSRLLLARASSSVRASVAPTIPTFFHPNHTASPLAVELRNTAHRVALQYKERGLLEDDELEDLWHCIAGVVARRQELERKGMTSNTQTDSETDSYVSYEELLEVRDAFVERLNGNRMDAQSNVNIPEVDDGASRVSHYFSASTFARFSRRHDGRIDGRMFMEFVVRHIALTQSRINLGCHDGNADGYLEEAELLEFVERSVATMSALRSLTPQFTKPYCEIAVRRFMFVHDVKRRGKVQISDLLAGTALADFNELHAADKGDARLLKNWFSLQCAKQTYDTFIELDRDESGGLSREEFRKITFDNRCNNMCFVQGLTSVFADRIFEAHSLKGPLGAKKAREAFNLSNSPSKQDPFIQKSMEQRRKQTSNEMDFHAYLDFALAWSNKTHPASLNYFFKALDVSEKNVLTNYEIWTFLKSVHDAWLADPDNYDLDMLDVRDEIFDMVKPQVPGRITLSDLTNCKCADTVIEILTDHTGFWKYDNRESLPSNDEEEEGEDEEDVMLVDDDGNEF